MGALDGRHALVTGGGSGIGAAIARKLAGEGARITLAGRRLEPLQEAAASLPDAAAVRADVTDEADVAALFEAAGPVDILVANAGMAESAPLGKTSLDLWNATLSVNLTGAFLCARAAAPAMAEAGWGRILFVGSTAGLKGYPYVGAYCAAKHGLVGLARSLAVELARTGTTVNALCPGYTETPLLEKAVENIRKKTGRDDAEARRMLVSENPQGRFVQPDEVAAAALWLCLPGAEAVNGQAIAINGGEQ